ncbi:MULTISPECIES: prolyl oligopeptidase family serine peptidase [Actinomyces]|uniref:S9 family peptidase n=1 Tax=Actinomyces respiraculi TaxID=2744574 RepID=A0A7T0LKE1_9ACTO|nr:MULTISPECIES: prolyl oligopeptidase family serine peptidase [Actinomyces]QPL05232.1 S9 family peptidase [Actinomyces respiraculi]
MHDDVTAHATTSTTPLPQAPAWLDDISGEQALAWVAERNAQAEARLASPALEELTRDLTAVLDAPDRIPPVAHRAGMVYGLWTDAGHPRGLWRRASWLSYVAGAPSRADRDPEPTEWETLLDLDALAAERGRPLVWGGAQVLTTGARAGRRALITLSDGGSDTSVTREYDLDARRFVGPDDGGFHRPPSKGSLVWGDEEGESVIVSADVGPGSLSAAGYPRQVRRLGRGTAVEEAEILVTAAPGSVAAGAARDPWGRTWLTTMPSFYGTRIWLLPDDVVCPTGQQAARAALDGVAHPALPAPTAEGDLVPAGAVRLEVPESASAGVGRDWLTIELREPWEVGGRSYAPGTLLGADLAAYLAGGRDLEVLFEPTATTTLLSATWTRNHLVLTVLDDVAGRLEVCTPAPAGSAPGTPWAHHWVDLTGASDLPGRPEEDDTLLRPGRALLSVSAAALDPAGTDYLWVSASGWTTPSTLTVARLTDQGEMTGMSVVRQAPARFDATGVRVSQHVATSADGTRVPYVEIGRPVPGGGPGRVLVHAYGAFGTALTPGYEPVTGKAWLERGGTYVVANTRGGGEYGPDWHRPTQGRGRGLVLEDLTAVIDSLVARGVAEAGSVVVHGSSAGGLLAGELLTRHPERVGAVVLEVPLLDMRRYSHLLAGASWVPEFGDPDDESQWEWMREHSPYHLLKEGRVYPPVLLLTSTRDDRVHPAHARTMAWRLAALGQDVTYVETAEGGHSGFATSAQRARTSALIHAFAWQHASPRGGVPPHAEP